MIAAADWRTRLDGPSARLGHGDVRHLFRFLVPGEHGLHVRARRPAQRGQVDVHQDEDDEHDAQPDVDGVDHARTAEQLDRAGEALQVPQHQPRVELERHQHHHDDLIGHGLHRVELAVSAHVVRVGMPLELAVGPVIPALHTCCAARARLCPPIQRSLPRLHSTRTASRLHS